MIKGIIDCDPGVDDVVALLYGAAHLDLLGITTVAGNVPVETATRNALTIADFAGLKVPVACGMERPWVAPPCSAVDVHGESLEAAGLPPPRSQPVQQHAVSFIIEQARRHPGVMLIALGPLTNVATALRMEPRLTELLGGITLMGGSTGAGNVTAAAEFNIYCDPEAAHAVFTSGIPLYMTGLNVTERVTVSEEHIARLRRSGKRTATAVAGLLEAHLDRVRSLFGLPAAPLHDPCALVPLIRPEFITYRPMAVAVELASPLTRGMTLCDQRRERGRDAEGGSAAQVAVDVNAPALLDHLLETLISYP